jgi:hypothetical protein
MLEKQALKACHSLIWVLSVCGFVGRGRADRPTLGKLSMNLTHHLVGDVSA